MTAAPTLHAPPPRTYSPAFYQALSDLALREDLRTVAPHAMAFWTELAQHGAAEPELEGPDEGALRFTWSGHTLYLHADIFPDGRRAWFFRDLALTRGEGTPDGPEPQLPVRFFDCLAAVSATL